MNLPFRVAALVAESLVYGPPFGYLNYLIRSPAPLDPETTWQSITRRPIAIAGAIVDRYPPSFLRRWLLVLDYRPTLRAWFDNLARNRDRAIELVGMKTYNRYLVYFPASWYYFDRMTGFVVRLVLEKDPPTQ